MEVAEEQTAPHSPSPLPLTYSLTIHQPSSLPPSRSLEDLSQLRRAAEERSEPVPQQILPTFPELLLQHPNAVDNMKPHTYAPEFQKIAWMYQDFSETSRVTEQVRDPWTGSIVFLRPTTFTPKGDEPNTRLRCGIRDAAAFVMQQRSTLMGTWVDQPQNLPTITLDRANGRILIKPHAEPFPLDLRAWSTHPDYLPKDKLCEYQAVEVAGFSVRRHDRDYLPCALPACGAPCVDHRTSTQLCPSCGPQTTVRYCSAEHLLSDAGRHWTACGSPALLFPSGIWIDADSAPARFRSTMPAITDAHGRRGFHRHRQTITAALGHGQYSLFTGGGVVTVKWPPAYHNVWAPRVERLLNLALLDSRLGQSAHIYFLFRVLRFALRLQELWTETNKMILELQFKLEFGCAVRGVAMLDPCECEWEGGECGERTCTDLCRKVAREAGIVHVGRGMKELLEKHEARSWMLRAWQHQHPWVSDCWERMVGVGFPGVEGGLADKRAILGKGWQGRGQAGKVGEWEEKY